MIKYDTHINMRIEKELLDDFKKLCGKKYQNKIRELMSAYVKKYANIDKKEQELRREYLNVESYIR